MSNKTILQSNNDALSANNLELQNLIDLANALPEASSGIELPTLSNEGIADDLVEGKELIDSTGNIITGTNPYEKVATNNAIAAEADLITQIQTALEGKSSGGNNLNQIETCTGTITTSHRGSPEETYTCYYMNKDLEQVSFSSLPSDDSTFTVVKNSIFILCPWSNMSGTVDENCSIILRNYGIYAFTATNDFILQYEG